MPGGLPLMPLGSAHPCLPAVLQDDELMPYTDESGLTHK